MSVLRKRCSCQSRAVRITCVINLTESLIAGDTAAIRGSVALPVTIHTTSWQRTPLSTTQNVWLVISPLVGKQKLPRARRRPVRLASSSAQRATCRRLNCPEPTANLPITGSASSNLGNRYRTECDSETARRSPRVSQGVAPSPLPLGSEYVFPHRPTPGEMLDWGRQSRATAAQAIPYGLEGAELAIVVTRFFHSGGAVE